jgi:hypothetical protein
MHRSRIALIALLAASLRAQVPQPETKPAPTLVVRIECAAPGSPVPRTTDPKAPAAALRARRWEGRKLVWHIGDTLKVDTLVGLERELRRIAQDPASMRDSVDQPGKKELLPVLLRPGDDARWCDVTQSFDVAMMAGFYAISIDGAGTPWFVPKMVDHPLLDAGALIVPKVLFNEPDDRPDPRRPVFEVHQDGRIVVDGVTLFTWVAGKADDLEPLRARLAELRADLVARGHLVKRPSDRREMLDVPLLVCADVWTEWRDVRRLLQVVTDPSVGFWKLEVGVAEFDYEAKLRDATKATPAEKR